MVTNFVQIYRQTLRQSSLLIDSKYRFKSVSVITNTSQSKFLFVLRIYIQLSNSEKLASFKEETKRLDLRILAVTDELSLQGLPLTQWIHTH